MTQDEQLEEAINQLSEKKEDLITEEALLAKEEYDMAQFDHDIEDEDALDQIGDIDLFNDHVKCLIAVFKQSKFDEFVHLLGRPHRLYVIQLFMGIFRGVGFVLGALFILTVLLYAAREWGVLQPLLSVF